MATNSNTPVIRYEPDDSSPPWVTIGASIQGATLVIAPTVLFVAISVQSAGLSDKFLVWATFATLVIVGLMMALQAAKIGRFGGGHLIVCGVTPNYIAISVIALAEGGPTTLASLVVLSGILYYAVATWLPVLRRLITPVVASTVLMLIGALILPFAIDLIREIPEDAPGFSGVLPAAITAFVSVALMLRAPRTWRPWALALGIVSGTIAAAALGIYDIQPVIAADWIGTPEIIFSGIDIIPDLSFWALLPMFMIVTLIQAIKNISDGMVVQRVSRRTPRATDFRLIQGSMYANGTGFILSGLAGTLPTSTYSALTMSLVNMTGVAARNVGYLIGAILIALAFLPKFTGVLATIPSPVLGGFLLFGISLLFIEGFQSLARARLDVQKALVAGFAFAVGLSMQHHNIFADFMPYPWDLLFGNGITVGAAIAIALTAFLDLSGPRPRRFETLLEVDNLPKIDEFLRRIAKDIGWNDASTQNLSAAGEETLELLSGSYGASIADTPPRLMITARPEDTDIELEFVTVADKTNIEDRIAYIDEDAETFDESDISLRLLRHYASAVKHQKYHGVDIVTLTVTGSK